MVKVFSALAAAAALSLVAHPAAAQEKLTVGLLTTLSGPAASLGTQQRNGFQLAVKTLGNKLGGRDVELVIQDDELKPDVAVTKAKAMVERDKAAFVVGPIFSNILQAILKPVTDGGAFMISPNAGTSNFAGKECNANLFVVSYQNDQNHEVLGKYAQDSGIKKAFIMAPNYQAGKDALAGFKRYFKGEVAGEVYTTINQPDYSAELAQLRAARPDALYVFYPGGMGVNFTKQYAQAGLIKEVPFFSAFTIDSVTLAAIGDAAIGTYGTAFWNTELKNPANERFVADFEKKFKYTPSNYSAQSYDAALLLDAAIKAVGGKLDDKEALRAQFRKADFKSVRGPFKYNNNNFPIENFYLHQVVKDSAGKLKLENRGVVFKDHSDAYAKDCPLKW